MTNSTIDQRILHFASRQAGALAARQVVANRREQAQLDRRVAAGTLRRVRIGLLVHEAFPTTWRQNLWLGVLGARDPVAVNGQAAAKLHGLRTFDREVVEVLVHEGGNHLAPTVGALHQTFWLPEEHIVRVDGLPVTSIARTVFDLAGLPRHPMAFRNERLREVHMKRTTWLVNEAMRSHGLRMIDLIRVLAAIGRRGKPGTGIIRQIVDDLGADYAASASEIEDVFLDMVRAAGIEEPEREVNLGTKEKWIGRVDFRWRPPRKVIVEIDGSQHRAPLDRRADRQRDAAFVSEGGKVLRYDWWDLVHDPERVIREVSEALGAAAA
jgi:hypothetical protein